MLVIVALQHVTHELHGRQEEKETLKESLFILAGGNAVAES
jgi:hypothetical protein